MRMHIVSCTYLYQGLARENRFRLFPSLDKKLAMQD